jgi:predicted metal-dependent HD superfamily phosphohydrolase
MSIVEKSKEYVQSLFQDGNTELLTYHNWRHTLNVIEASVLIANNSTGVEKDKIEQIELAATFHDIGFLEGADNHELNGVKVAKKFLSEENYDDEKILLVERLILATKIGHNPNDLYEEIIMDADLSHLGKPNYMETTFQSLSLEINNCSESKMSKFEWVNKCILFLSEHSYYTEFAKEKYNEVKKENLEKIKNLAMQLEGKKEKKKKNKKTPTKADSPLKGVETMFKVALRNHINLSQIADNKANTLISVNAIIISIVLSALFPKLDSNPFLFAPGMSILIFTIITIIISILSTIPNVNRGLITRKEVEEKKGNLLFFGNFFKMSLPEYEWSMNELMNDKKYLYNSLTRDLYFLGKVLNKKYTLLRYAYFSFVLGLLASIIIFVVSISSKIHSW